MLANDPGMRNAPAEELMDFFHETDKAIQTIIEETREYERTRENETRVDIQFKEGDSVYISLRII